ncbi:MAG: hypothetical protein CMP23_07565 [Rickettsiales bacterium]|nr:hypothetical protein [Rickettsiales bacterium]
MAEVRLTLSLLRPHLKALALASLLAAVLASCQGALVLLVRQLLGALQPGAGSSPPVLLGLAIVVLFAIQGGARVGRTWLTRKSALLAERDLRNRLFVHLLHCDPARLRDLGLGNCQSRISHDAGNIRTAVGAGVTLLQRPLSALAIVAAAFSMAPRLTLWAGLCLPPIAAVIYLTGRATRREAYLHLQHLGSLESLARDGLLGLRTLQAYGVQETVSTDFRKRNEAQLSAALRATMFRISGPPIVEFTAACAVGAMVALGARSVQLGELDGSALVAFLVALGLLGEPLKGIATSNALWEEARAGMSRVLELLNLPVADQQLPVYEELADSVSVKLTGIELNRGRGALFSGLNLELQPGQLIVLQGESGTGKSTILDLIAGFVEPDAGEVIWNGVDANALGIQRRRRQLAFVDQRAWIGMGTIAEAIALGRPGAERHEIEDAATSAGLFRSGGLLEGLPDGLDSRVGDAGLAISGGEAQRISLARALLRKAGLLLLDEPTANLDLGAEQEFLSLLRSFRAQRCILLVSHRPGPLEFADIAYSLNNGVLTQIPPPSSSEAEVNSPIAAREARL